MADDKQDRKKSNPDESAVAGSSSSFAWEFEGNERRDPGALTSQAANESAYTPKPNQESSLILVGRNEQPKSDEATASSSKRAATARPVAPAVTSTSYSRATGRDSQIRAQLEQALDRWWAFGEVPSLKLLRDGLLMLEAGGSANEGQRTLLLRAALAHGRGIQTAMRYQVDSERVAMVLAEALVEWDPPLDPLSLPSSLGEDEQARLLLAAELERNRVLFTGEARRRAVAALELLPPPMSPVRYSSRQSPPKSVTAAITPRSKLMRQLLLFLLLITLVGFVLWQQRQWTPDGMVSMPAAEYAMLGKIVDAAPTSARLDAFFIDRFEVTNGFYRSCVESGQCAWPKSTGSTTRSDYFMNPAFNDYPVVNVTQEMASAYCAWQEKRLPTSEEWQAAASVSPTTGQAFRYPWGEIFDPQRTNSARTTIGDTVVVGSFRPNGDSVSGAADMAGNVAEWTSTLDSALKPSEFAIVKGGGFADESNALTVGSSTSLEIVKSSPEVGFRCARSYFLGG